MMFGKALSRVAIGFAVLMMFSLLIVRNVSAIDDELNLPSQPIRIEVSNATESYFNTKLMDVPSGYDVANGTYLGWCVDVRAEMARSPATHQVFLYSSLNPPLELADEEWDMINYILNHKQGAAIDIQQAIWYFIRMDGNYTPTSQVAWNIIEDALANGEGFIPDYGQPVAVICYPIIVFPSEPYVQISIIEIENTIIPEHSSPIVLVLMILTIFTAAAMLSRKKTLT
ncbi:MAG: hypothetical protein QHH24_05060 [Candidatus Bathyarchaeota archaeon]|nr:hypothetical protein [Candidatus Bathyarchaeota archaeon]